MTMLWLAWFLPFLSGVCDAVSRSVIKATKIHKFTLLSAGFIFSLPFYLVWLYFEGIPTIQPMFWVAVVIHVFLMILAASLTVDAHRESALIATMPYLSFTPAFLLITSPLMNAGNPGLIGIVGVLILTCGFYILNTKSHKNLKLLDPFKIFKRESGSWKMFLVSIIFAFTANLDFIAFRNANAPFYLLVDSGLCGIIFCLLAVIYKLKGRTGDTPVSPLGSIKILNLFGALIAMSIMSYMLAFRWIKVVPYLIATKRAGAIVLTISFGLIMAFIVKHKEFTDEKNNLQYRIPGAMLMLIGMLIIILWGKT
ncbi:hypothetical protein ACFL29_02370 [Patescibacteria group bacterium]